jgi:hypothetical protein
MRPEPRPAVSCCRLAGREDDIGYGTRPARAGMTVGALGYTERGFRTRRVARCYDGAPLR